MTEYRISNRQCFYYHKKDDYIAIGMKKSNLTDDELIVLTSDALIHEHMHLIIGKLFNTYIGALFDVVQEHFRENIELKEKYNKQTGIMSWKKYINLHGKKSVHAYYFINDNFYNKLKELTERRTNKKC